jgi:hypothetical protein
MQSDGLTCTGRRVCCGKKKNTLRWDLFLPLGSEQHRTLLIHRFLLSGVEGDRLVQWRAAVATAAGLEGGMRARLQRHLRLQQRFGGH